MTKTLNQRIYETPGDIKKAIYDSGYEAGKKAIVEELINEVYLGVGRECVDEDGSFMPGPFMNLMLDLKQKYGVK